MIAIRMMFPAGRFHATPWGRQVNEGAVEWPPSPWRILRALLAMWHRKCPDVSQEDIRSLIAALSPLPNFHLPPAGQGHTRHYMPVAGHKTTKIFDTFITVPRDQPVIVIWPDAVLDAPQRKLLNKLLNLMSYFGRAESWVRAELDEDWSGEANAFPLCAEEFDEQKQERVRVLATLPEEQFEEWRPSVLSDRLESKQLDKQEKARVKEKDPAKVKLSPKERAAIEVSIPATIFDALHVETGDMRKAGWNRPPGSRWVTYVRSRKAFAASPIRRKSRTQLKPTVARFAVCSSVRPRLTESLFIGERVRTSLMSKSDGAAVFSGKQPDGTRSDNGHQHAHILCEAPANDGRISHITVFASCGFDHQARSAISKLCRVWGQGGHDLQLVLLGFGQPEDFGGPSETEGQSRILDAAKTWISRTPFVLTRHLKSRGGVEQKIQSLRQCLFLELKRREWITEHVDKLEMEGIEPLLARHESGTSLGGHFTHWLKFRRERNNGHGFHAGSHGHGFRLRFKEPIRGPIALGYGCHFGLGQFIPDLNGS